jgi:hypothetical protein
MNVHFRSSEDVLHNVRCTHADATPVETIADLSGAHVADPLL